VSKKRVLLGAVVALAALWLGTDAGVWAYEKIRDDREAAKARAEWPGQRAQIEAAFARVTAPADWAETSCDPPPSSPPASAAVRPSALLPAASSEGQIPDRETLERCWLGSKSEPADYETAAMTALQKAGVPNVGWECGDIPQPARMPTSCHAGGVVGGRGVIISVNGHLDRAASLRDRKITFTGVDISLRADVTLWY
jgi:hypothetical protein